MNTSIRSLFKQYNENTPGCAVGVIQNGNILSDYYVGLADVRKRKPISINTSFRLASLTKPFTAMAIMILEEQNVISYDDNLQRYFCGFPLYGRNITIRQLLSHTSGVRDHEKPLYPLVRKNNTPTLLDALCVLNRTRKTYFTPGSRFRYSDAGYVLLALIIERVSGMTYAQFLTRVIFKPLKLDNTIVCENERISIPQRAMGYKRNTNLYEIFDNDRLNYIVGDEGIYSTISDLAKWTIAWETDVLVRKSTLSFALEPYRLSDRTEGRCGFAWFIERGINTVRFQDGIWVGFTNIMLTDVLTKTTVIVLSNTRDYRTETDRVAIARQVLSLYRI